MRKKLILLGLINCFLASCSTSYHQRGFLGNGYSDYRMNQDRFSVTFRGNEYTDVEDVRRFAIMRAAELTLQNGFYYFTIVSERDLSRYLVEQSVSENKDYTFTRKEKKQAPGINLVIRCYHDNYKNDTINAREFLSYNPVKKTK